MSALANPSTFSDLLAYKSSSFIRPKNAAGENIYISGDTPDALHHLVKSYEEVKCIYIDPPYNIGTDDFVYNDKFRFTAEELERKLSISSDEAEKITAMTSGHRANHTAWLTFMIPPSVVGARASLQRRCHLYFH